MLVLFSSIEILNQLTAGEMDQEDCEPSFGSPLIPNSEVSHGFGAKVTQICCDSTEIIAELKKQTQLAGPLVVASLLQYSLQMISVMFVGHLGELSLSSASMATSFAGVTGFSFMLGMGSALDTFCGQAYGAKQYHMLGIYMQRAMVVLVLMSIPIAFLWACTGQIFLHLGQNPEISLQAGIYARWLIPSIFPYGLLQCQFKFLQTQNNVLPLMISTGVTSSLHVVVCWMLVLRFGFGNEGAALSSAISYWINVLILAIYIKFSSTCQQTWTGFSEEGVKNLFNFLNVGIPSALMVCLEFWSYEFLVLMSGFLPNPKLETSIMSISLNTSSVVFRIPFGLGSAVSTRVSNELGAGKPRSARLAVQVVLFLAVTEGLLLSITAIAVQNVWGYLYTNEEEVVRYLASIMPVLAASNFMDGIQGVLSGTARGCGWQKMGAFVNLGAYYLLGLPSAIILTFVFHFGGKGFWMGIICGSASQALLLLAVTMRTDWGQEICDRLKTRRCCWIPNSATDIPTGADLLWEWRRHHS
ncbi:protein DETOXIFICATION 16-like isoform X1 [Malania oleifera]|uniref:protein DETOXIFICATION 16-like isoform X1 n=1 Tax=Malania oleifera TaxID=397392 RepID=UPI0025AE2D6C|nr:protein DETOXIFICATION 16-like isoform X1 [Malania oleifera]XP_057952475.1 protein DETOXIFICATION 16-like isoform X1 [Malania oleifera]